MKHLKRRLDRVTQQHRAVMAYDAGLRRRMLGRRIMADPEALDASLELFRWISSHITDPRAPWEVTTRQACSLPEAQPVLERLLPILQRVGV